MQRILYIPPWEDPEDTSKGVIMGLGYPYIIGSPRGVGGVDATVAQENSPYSSGAMVNGVTMNSREITFFIHIRGATREDMYRERRRLSAALVPFNGRQYERPGRLYYENDAGRYWIAAIPINSPDPQERIGHYNKANVTFLCPDPFFRSVDRQSRDLLYTGAMFEFPFEFDVEFGAGSYSVDLSNLGSVATPVVIRVTGTYLENPTITNKDTGEYIRVIRTVGPDKELVINTSPWERGVKLVDLATGTEESAYGHLDVGSRFWHLLPGNNVISYHGDEDNFDAHVVVEWYPRYAGV